MAQTPSQHAQALNGLEQMMDSCDGFSASPSTGVVARVIVARRATLTTLWLRAAVAGTAGQTDAQVRVNGSLVGGVAVIDNAASDPSVKTAGVGVDVEAGDYVEVDLTAVATGATGVAVMAELVQRLD